MVITEIVSLSSQRSSVKHNSPVPSPAESLTSTISLTAAPATSRARHCEIASSYRALLGLVLPGWEISVSQ